MISPRHPPAHVVVAPPAVSPAGSPGATVAALATAAAVAVPPLLAWNLPPTSTFFNQAAALGLWGLAIAVAAVQANGGAGAAGRAVRATWPLLLVLGVLAVAAIAGGLFGPLPSGLSLTPALALGAAALALLAGAAGALREPVLRGFMIGLVAAGVASALVAAVQVFLPGLADGTWIARTTLAGRAVGNLRQPNHLGTLLLWSAIALVPLVEARQVRRGAAVALWLLLIVALELTGSRTGALGTGVLATWGLLDRRLGRFARGLLLAAPVVYAVAWVAFWWAAQQGAAAVGAVTRAGEGDLSSSRFAIWANAIALVAAHPWAGVGFGRFNFAWSLTPFPDRPVAFFDHVHNLPLQFAVELGLPLAALLTGLLLLALWRAGRTAMAGDDVARRALFVMLLLVGLHSLLEYPLWYLHFLLPAAWAWGACVGASPAPAAAVSQPRMRALVVGGLAMALGAGLAVADYLRVARIFTPPARPAPLAQRIADGQRSLWFGHHADYAAATAAKPATPVLPAAQRAAYHLIDTRLAIAWARAYAEAGDVDRARHLAQRLREFRNPASREFFAPCEPDAATPQAPLPFQCEPPSRRLEWRDFERRAPRPAG